MTIAGFALLLLLLLITIGAGCHNKKNGKDEHGELLLVGVLGLVLLAITFIGYCLKI